MADLNKGLPIVVSDENLSNFAEISSIVPLPTAVGLVVRDATQGSKTSAESRPVVIASDQQVARNTVTINQASVTSTPTALPNTAIQLSCTIKAHNSNTESVYIGLGNTLSATNGFELGPGESLTIPASNLNLIYHFANGTQRISYIGV